MAYDTNNIFAKILRGDIPCKKLFENEHVLAFHDISPRAPVHVLVIPKGAYKDMDDFTTRASDAEIGALMRGVGEAARMTGVHDAGYRVINNCGVNGGQEVPHLHFHILGGRRIGSMVQDA